MAKLAIGMAVGLRINTGTVYDYCDKATFSLRQAGFTEVLHCFTEPQAAAAHIKSCRRWNVQVHENAENLGCYRNFRQGLNWLRDNTDADWLLMLQDDCIWRADGAQVIHDAINSGRYNNVGFLSPYTSKAMVPSSLQAKGPAWWASHDAWAECRFHNNAFWGAVAMLFPRASAARMENESERYRGHRHHRKLDVVVGNAMRVDLGLSILVHVPSVCDHIGSWSTLGRHRLKGNKWGRRGFLFRTR